MACGARSGLKRQKPHGKWDICRLNGLWSPFGIETVFDICEYSYQQPGLNGLWSPFGIETAVGLQMVLKSVPGLNGLWSPFGIETGRPICTIRQNSEAKWPVEPVRD